MTSLVRVGDQTDILGESPLWNEHEQALYWVDIRRPAIRRFDSHRDRWAGNECLRRRKRPDGSTVDADGCLCNAKFNAQRIVRCASDGRVDRLIELPVQRPTCCAFGGPNLDILYVTTASQQMTAGELEAQPLAGALLASDVGVRGIPEPRFALTPQRHARSAMDATT